MESLLLAQAQALSLWIGSADSKTLDYQRTPNPKEYQIERILTKATTSIQDPASPNCSSVLCRMPHPNRKQDKSANLIVSRQDYPLTQPCPSEGKKKTKFSANLTLHKAYTNLRKAETKRRKEFNLEAWEKETSNTIS